MEREGEELDASNRGGKTEFPGKDSIFPMNPAGNAGKEPTFPFNSAGNAGKGSMITHESVRGDYAGNVSGAGSAHPYSETCSMIDGENGFVVEELTVENCRNQNLGLADNENSVSKHDPLEFRYGSASGFRYMSKGMKFTSMASQNQGFKAEDSNFHTMLRNRFPVGAAQVKTLPKSSFSELFGKKSLKGKGEDVLNKNLETFSSSKLDVGSSDSVVDRPIDESFRNGISLRDLISSGRCGRDKVESFRLFRLIVEFVDSSHCQGVLLQDLRPSCFRILSSNKIVYTGLSVKGELNMKRPLAEDIDESGNLGRLKRLKLKSHMKTSGLASGFGSQDFNSAQKQLQNLRYSNGSFSGSSELEYMWYGSPEELSGRTSTFSSNIYSLGVLLFELLCCSESWEAHCKAMTDLRHRILSPSFLSKNSKEAGFCLWLLHPEPHSRPTSREILQYDFMCSSQEPVIQDEIPPFSSDDLSDIDLLSDFLTTLEDQKRKHASRLADQIAFLEQDIKEVAWDPSFSTLSDFPRTNASGSVSGTHMNNEWLIKNISKLGDAYFSMKSQSNQSKTVDAAFYGKRLVKKAAPSEIGNGSKDQKPAKPLGPFFENLCKFARYSKFELCGNIRSNDLLSSPNVICSVSFDRDEDFFATAGISKKIKIFDFGAFMNDSIDIHYPVVEMSNKSKLSCVCWNSYIKNYLASTDYDGIVQMWDMSTGQGFRQYHEHLKRAWSVDFSKSDPTQFASGSDDWSVKLWNINERNSVATLRSNANVCSLQFSPFSPHLLAFGSVDYKVYCYDLRHVRTHLCTLAGHDKSISYVKFVDSKTLVSASTDNSLKLWDLSKASSADSSNACRLTFNGHKNEKNFVGLSVLDGYIACGSETNEVFCYYKSFPMPVTSYKFGAVDPISRNEVIDDAGQFVSSVCWRRKSNMLVAANSTGSIKLLKLV